MVIVSRVDLVFSWGSTVTENDLVSILIIHMWK